MTRYSLECVGNLLVTKAAVSGLAGVKVVRLLVDTGSAYTILPVEVLESVGCSPAASADHVRLITGSGYLIVPRVRVLWFQCFGRKENDMTVVAHTLPFGILVDGLLGMDFLRSLNAHLLISTLSIYDELNMQKPWKICAAGGFWDITWLPRTLHKVSVSQKAYENSHFFISSNG